MRTWEIDRAKTARLQKRKRVCLGSGRFTAASARRAMPMAART
jgi:hypothetical protein